MFTKRIHLFRLFGFDVSMDLSWLILAVLITWTLAEGVFPYMLPHLSTGTYWWMGAAGTIGLFVSIVFHELSHSLVARRMGLQMGGITLFIFGGVAEMTEEPPSPKAEFWMALAGPFSSVVLAGIFWGIAWLGGPTGWPETIDALLRYLAFLNLILAVFNMIPAFPLDGGRVLRSILWKTKKNLRWATRITSNIGSFFGILLIALGVFEVITGDFIGGIWWALIGLFLRGAAHMSYRQMLFRQALEGEPVSRFMTASPVTVPAGATVQELVEDYVYRHHHKFFPVMDHERLVGCISTTQLKEIPRDEWTVHRVAELSKACEPNLVVSPKTDAVKALSMMSGSSQSRLMVVEDGRLVGIISLKDLMRFLSVKLDLEDVKH